MEVVCPLPAALTDIPWFNCGVQFDQIVSLAFQLPGYTFPTLSGAGGIAEEASWLPLLDATDDTKVVITPNFGGGLIIPPSEGNFEGGNDNTTYGGVRLYKGEQSVVATGRFINLPSAVREALRTFSQFSLASIGVSNLGVYMFTRMNLNKIIAINKDDEFRSIPIYNFRISSLGTEGLGAPNVTNFSFDLLPDWDEGVELITPNFVPYDLWVAGKPVTP
jgi:hypothetical protein